MRSIALLNSQLIEYLQSRTSQGRTATTLLKVSQYFLLPRLCWQTDCSDSQLDGYKRGAFLEKTDRFSKEKESEVPGESY